MKTIGEVGDRLKKREERFEEGKSKGRRWRRTERDERR